MDDAAYARHILDLSYLLDAADVEFVRLQKIYEQPVNRKNAGLRMIREMRDTQHRISIVTDHLEHVFGAENHLTLPRPRH